MTEFDFTIANSSFAIGSTSGLKIDHTQQLSSFEQSGQGKANNCNVQVCDYVQNGIDSDLYPKQFEGKISQMQDERLGDKSREVVSITEALLESKHDQAQFDKSQITVPLKPLSSNEDADDSTLSAVRNNHQDNIVTAHNVQDPNEIEDPVQKDAHKSLILDADLVSHSNAPSNQVVAQVEKYPIVSEKVRIFEHLVMHSPEVQSLNDLVSATIPTKSFADQIDARLRQMGSIVSLSHSEKVLESILSGKKLSAEQLNLNVAFDQVDSAAEAPTNQNLAKPSQMVTGKDDDGQINQKDIIFSTCSEAATSNSQYEQLEHTQGSERKQQTNFMQNQGTTYEKTEKLKSNGKSQDLSKQLISGQMILSSKSSAMIKKIQSYTPLSISSAYSGEYNNDSDEFSSLEGNSKQLIVANMRDMVIKSKLWDQQHFEDDDSLDEGAGGWSSSEERHQHDCNSQEEDSDDLTKSSVQKNNAERSGIVIWSCTGSKLNHNAQVFIPKKVSTAVLSAPIDGKENLPTSTVNGLPPENKLVPSLKAYQNQQLAHQTFISPDKIHFQNEKKGNIIFEEGEEDDILAHCRNNAERMGDVSPRYSRSSKKNHQKKKSWDGKIADAPIVRTLPMRMAKQKKK